MDEAPLVRVFVERNTLQELIPSIWEIFSENEDPR